MDHDDSIERSTEAGATTATHREQSAEAGMGGILPSFLAELARAMQGAAERERDRIVEVIADEAAQHAEKTRTRATAESGELRRLAEEDVNRIQEWATTEIDRIRREAASRTDARRSDLESYLVRHDSIITTEIDGLDEAVRDYRATLDRFFAELTGSTSPAEIARLAGQLPPPPDLDAVRGEARARAVSAFVHPDQESVTSASSESQTSQESPSEESDDDHSSNGTWAGVPVMDADAAEESQFVPDVLGVATADTGEALADAGEATPDAEALDAPPPDELRVSPDDDEDAVAPAAGRSAAVWLRRTIAPWTSSSEPDGDEDDATAH
jgi:hypothetical protein